MTITSRPFKFMTLSFGCIGFVACVAGIFIIWIFGLRLNQVVINIFTQIDLSFLSVQERVEDTGERVQSAKISSKDIEQNLKNWAKNKAGNRLSSQLEVEEKAKNLAFGLHQVDHWLEFSMSSVQIIQKAQELGKSTGTSVDIEPVKQLLDDLVSLRVQLSKSIKLIENIRNRISNNNKDKLFIQDADHLTKMVLRLIVTLSSIDSHLKEFETKMTKTQSEAQSLKITTQRWILIKMIVLTLLIIWMAAGQISLCFHGWKGLL